jgi:hypothetical protein
MADENTATRVEIVTANIAAAVNMYGDEAYNRIMTTCLKDISVSLAMLVDGGSTAEGD